MAEKRVFSVGDLCVDILQEVALKLKFGEEHALNSLDFSVGGNAANFAVISSDLGLNTLLISAIGTDFASSFLKKRLAFHNVGARLVKSGSENAVSVISVNRRGERAIQSMKNCLSELNALKVEKNLLPKLGQGDIVFFGGFYHLVNLRRGFLSLLKKIKKKGAIICFDTCFDTHGVWDISKFLPFIDFLFVNDVELKHVAKGSTTNVRASSLLKKGAGCVVVKQSDEGATIFRQGFTPKHFFSVADDVVDATGAGDAFNAGFVYGLANSWSLLNCVISGNYVAAKTVAVHGLATPGVKELVSFVGRCNRPEIVVAKNHDEMGRLAAELVIGLLKRNPSASIALPTGETPKALYRLLVSAYRKKEVDFSKATFFALDEYAGLESKNRNSFSFFLNGHFLSRVNASKQNIHLLNGTAKDLRREVASYEEKISKKGLDLCLLGIGRNGHIAFNEPGSSGHSITRVIRLSDQTRKVNGREFLSGFAPEKALTVGIGTILHESRRVLLLASGKHKHFAVMALLDADEPEKWPASFLRTHFNLVVLVDRQAFYEEA